MADRLKVATIFRQLVAAQFREKGKTKLRRTAFACLVLLISGAANAQSDGVEGCHFELVDHTVTLTEGFGWDDLFFQDTPYEDAIAEMVEELDEEIENPAPGYYQIRYFVRSGWFPA